MGHSGAAVIPAVAARLHARRRVLAPARGLALCGLMLAGAALIAALAAVLILIGAAIIAGGRHTARTSIVSAALLGGFGYLLPWALLAARWLAARTRRLAGEWCGVPIAAAYLPRPGGTRLSYPQRLRWLLADRATWRDLLWLAVNAAGAWVLAAAPAALVAGGLLSFFLPGRRIALAAVPLLAAGVAAGPWLLRQYALAARCLLGPAPGRGRRQRRVTAQAAAAPGPYTSPSGAGPRLLAPARGLALAGLALASAALVLVLPLAGLLKLGVSSTGGFTAAAGLGLLLFPLLVALLRRLANLARLAAGRWCGVVIAVPYLPPPVTGGKLTVRERYRWLWRDPATWRDVLWLVVNAAGGWVLAVLPAGLIALGLIGFIAPALSSVTHVTVVAFPGIAPPVLALLGVMVIAAGLAAGPRLLRAYGLAARRLLGPAGQAELAERVQHLAQTRAETIDAGAAEMRRIERDLHDGAQARLVAMGMTLDAAGQLMETDPAAARALLLEARDSSARALAELRDLVRGIHPPVLADRGLADAVRALALDSPLRVQVVGGLAARPPAPVESAAYFAVSELLANVTKHAGAGQVWIDLRHDGGMLRIGVSDDGGGGADPARGTGLRGIERRLAAFDGVLAVTSPPGGPTVATMEIPCALPAGP